VQQKYSALLGIIGGIVDIVAGLALLQSGRMVAEQTMAITANAWGGYLLLSLGVIVLVTGLYLYTPRMMNQSIIGALMLLYGAVMLGLGVTMIGQMFSMMQGSSFSGTVMIILGLAMLYSGYGMAR
jgi:hypothetical protein